MIRFTQTFRKTKAQYSGLSRTGCFRKGTQKPPPWDSEVQQSLVVIGLVKKDSEIWKPDQKMFLHLGSLQFWAAITSWKDTSSKNYRGTIEQPYVIFYFIVNFPSAVFYCLRSSRM